VAFRGWSEGLPLDIEVCPLQPPGREARFTESPCRSMAELVDGITETVAELSSLPFAFFGHSLGAVAAFEVARCLRERGIAGPTHLIVAGHPGPQVPRAQPPTSALSDAAFVARVRELRGLPEHVLSHPELLDVVLPALRADYEIIESYSYAPGEPMDIAIAALAGADDPFAAPAAVETWRTQTTGTFQLEVLPGGHFFVHSERTSVLQLIDRTLGSR
jgi:medium-chain acyl-[acyl-carrier-protein] hydrolase